MYTAFEKDAENMGQTWIQTFLLLIYSRVDDPLDHDRGLTTITTDHHAQRQ